MNRVATALDLRAIKDAKTYLVDQQGFEIEDVFVENEFVNIVALDEDENIHAIRVTCNYDELSDNSNLEAFRGVAERECFAWLVSKSEDCDFTYGRVIFDCIDMVVCGGNQALLRFHHNVLG